ncbi:MAG: hypothetical protein ACUVQR_13395 [Thermogutta sp.]
MSIGFSLLFFGGSFISARLATMVKRRDCRSERWRADQIQRFAGIAIWARYGAALIGPTPD